MKNGAFTVSVLVTDTYNKCGGNMVKFSLSK